MGPKGGEIKRLDALIMAKEIGDADTIGARMMGFEPEEICHLRIYLEQTHGGRIEVRGDSLDALASPFRRATLGGALLAQHDVCDKGACSACVNALILSLRIAGPIDGRLTFCLAKGKLPAGADRSSCIAFGNCSTIKDAGIRVRGCPPYPYELEQELRANGILDTTPHDAE
jgi:hypothetical protein